MATLHPRKTAGLAVVGREMRGCCAEVSRRTVSSMRTKAGFVDLFQDLLDPLCPYHIAGYVSHLLYSRSMHQGRC